MPHVRAPLLRTVLLCAALLAPAGAPRAGDLTVFAASSLATALAPIGEAWEAAGGGPVVMAFGASSALARQIIRGAPADVFVAASPDWMDAVEAEGRIVRGSRRDLLTNALVLVGPAGAAPLDLSKKALLAALGDGKLAMALVDAVPAGVYGKAALTDLGVWAALEPHVAQTANVRAALALVATGAAPLGVVYATDARAEPRVAVLAGFPPHTHPPIRYPAAAIRGGDPDGAAAFLDFLQGPEAAAVFEGEGFGLVR